MANYVRISTIGAKLYNVRADLKPEEAVDEMLGHLKYEIGQVLPDKPDLIILPEACDTPLNYMGKKKAEYHEIRGNKVLEFFMQIASANKCYITYPAIQKANDGTWRNSTSIIDRTGNVIGTYDKNHLYPGEILEDGILCGSEAKIINCDFGRVAFVICFDLNFDELRLKYAAEKPDLIIFSSAYHGGLMQNYWAYSCRSHFVSAVSGFAPSGIISPVGEVIASSTNYFDFVTANINLDCAVVHLDYNQECLKAMKSKYGRKVNVSDPGYLASVLISSETDELTIKEMAEEFQIELLDDYMKRALSLHHLPEYKGK